MKNVYNVKHIAIVGGGTSGWLAAAFLSNQRPDYTITIIDKEVGSPVGVGEGTNWICWLIQLGLPLVKKTQLTDEQLTKLIFAHAETELNKEHTAISHVEYLEILRQRITNE